MKVIDKIEIEYVIPESAVEQAEIDTVIKNFEAKQREPILLSEYKKVTKQGHGKAGYWRIKSGANN